jgi:pyruvate dehydrogenase E1 component alpha subunit
MKWAKNYALENGPLFIEYLTYRLHGHSMSDPGLSYRTRDEVAHVRNFRDPIVLAKHLLAENSWASESELKDIEKEIRRSVEADVEKLLLDPEPGPESLYQDVT